MTRHKGMSRKMALTASDLADLDRLHSRLKRLHEDMNPSTEATVALMAASATLAATVRSLAGEGDWLATTGAHKGAVGADGLVELEAIWTDIVRMAGTLGVKAESRHPLMVGALTVKAALVECSGLGSTWSYEPIYLRQALQRAREQPPAPKTYMFQGFGEKRVEPPKRIEPTSQRDREA